MVLNLAAKYFAAPSSIQCRTCLTSILARYMATSPKSRANLSHEERTASSPRQDKTHKVKLAEIHQLSSSVRLINLKPVAGANIINFLPGQWLDVGIPGLPKAGGFTITSAPPNSVTNFSETSDSNFSLELAVQKSPKNPPAAWLWQPEQDIIGSELTLRVGGTFTWPPPFKVWTKTVYYAVMVAGGVGINPLMSMIRHIYSCKDKDQNPTHLMFYYATKAGIEADGSDVLFLKQLREMAKDFKAKTGCSLRLELFVTPAEGENVANSKWDASKVGLSIHHRRMTDEDLADAVPDEHCWAESVCYICGPPPFTDHFVDVAEGMKGLKDERIMYEKWW